ncbi:CAP domain-containing protein [Bifidobacterium thermacidophilum]|uniref:CAP domain-containing protein n=1 Tax=Bifidobacterium thermacidophilum TaxID=246618 RepID=A0ABW8KP91_9BIFI
MSQRIMTPKVTPSRHRTRAVVITTVITTAFAAALMTTPLSAMASQPAATTTAATTAATATTQSAALRQTRDAMQSAKDNLDAKTRQTEEAKTRVTTATAKYNAAKAAQQQTAKATASQTTKEAQSALGFFKSHNADAAAKILTDSSVNAYMKYTHAGEDGDATTLEYLLDDLKYLDEVNDVRKENGVEPLKISDRAFAAAIAQANMYQNEPAGDPNTFEHHGFIIYSENYGPADSVALWAAEKSYLETLPKDSDGNYVIRDNNDYQRVGHYLNLVNSATKLGAVARGRDLSVFEGIDTPEDGEATYTVDEYRTMLNNYITNIKNAKPKLESANTALTNAKTALDAASSAYSKAMQEERNARQEYQRAKAAYDNCLKGNCPTPTPTPQPATIAMQRLYNPYTGEHFYTSSAQERDALKRAGWRYEGIGWTAPKTGDPVYRLYNPYAPGGDHHYTTSTRERDTLKQAGWRYEGVGWMSAPAADKTRKPLHREYNPYATTGTHNYTLDTTEHRHLITLGWHDEGTAWYATA